jgi:bacteriocin biosynthesis cyclodehydratase domain-containing protein
MRVKDNNYYVLRPDCKIVQKTKGKFKVFVNQNEEIIEVDEDTSEILQSILPLLDGSNSVKDIIKKIDFSSVSVAKKVIGTLFRWGLIANMQRPNKGNIEVLQTKYFSAFTSYPENFNKTLKTLQVGVIGNDDIIPFLAYSMYISGIRKVKIFTTPATKIKNNRKFNWYKNFTSWINQPPEDFKLTYESRTFEEILQDLSLFKKMDLMLVILPSLNKENTHKVNESCVNAKTKVMFGALDFNAVCIGPFVIPSQSSCLSCMQSRLSENRDCISKGDFNKRELFFLETFENKKLPENLPAFIMGYLNLLVGWSISHILEISDFLINHQIIINCGSGNIEKYFILKSPRCPVCSPWLK